MSLPFRAAADPYRERKVEALRGSELLLDPYLVRWGLLDRTTRTGYRGQREGLGDEAWFRLDPASLGPFGLAWLRIAADSPRGIDPEVRAAAAKMVEDWHSTQPWGPAWASRAQERQIPFLEGRVGPAMGQHSPIPWPFWVCPQLRATKKERSLRVPVAPEALTALVGEITEADAFIFLDASLRGPTEKETGARLALLLEGEPVAQDKLSGLGNHRALGLQVLEDAARAVAASLSKQPLRPEERVECNRLFAQALATLHGDLAPRSLEGERPEVVQKLRRRLLQVIVEDENPARGGRTRWFPGMNKGLRLYIVGQLLVTCRAIFPPDEEDFDERGNLLVKRMDDALRKLRRARPTADEPLAEVNDSRGDAAAPFILSAFALPSEDPAPEA